MFAQDLGQVLVQVLIQDLLFATFGRCNDLLLKIL